MRYVPNLIPAHAKVLPHYFKGNIYKATKKNPLRDALMWILGGGFSVGALASIQHPWLFFIWGLLGFILLPVGHQWIEKTLRFRLTTKTKAVAIALLFIGSLPLNSHYMEMDRQAVYEKKLLDEKLAREKAIAEKLAQQRKDSLSFYLQRSAQLGKRHKMDAANQQLQQAATFASDAADKDAIAQQKVALASINVADWIKAGKYQAALTEVEQLLDMAPANTEIMYYRALCYSKTGKIQEAVNDLKPLVQAGNAAAEKLHNQINPLRKRISYYVTRCWDGSTSNATGRGACSHHGGVKNWNEPVYETYRKYE